MPVNNSKNLGIKNPKSNIRLDSIPGLVNWLIPDASHLFDTNSLCTALQDKSPSKIDTSLQGTTGRRIGLTIGNLASKAMAWDFVAANSSSYFWSSGSGLDFAKNVSGITFVIAFRPTTVATTFRLKNISINASSSSRATMGITNGDLIFVGGRRTDADAAVNVQTGYALLDEPMILIGTIDYQNKICNLYKNGVLVKSNTNFQTAGSTPNTSSNIVGFSYSGGGTEFFNGKVYGDALYNRALTSDEVQTVFKYFNILTRIPTLTKSTARSIVMMGDSIVAGVGISSYTDRLNYQLWQLFGGDANTYTQNHGRSGATTVSLAAAPHTDVAGFQYLGQTPIVTVMIGTNDCSAGTSGATAYANIRDNIMAPLIAAGVKVVVGTPIARGGGFSSASRTELTALRTLILANAVNDGALCVADIGGDANFLTSSTTVYQNTTNYQGDQIHPTPAGLLIIAAIIKAAIILVGY